MASGGSGAPLFRRWTDGLVVMVVVVALCSGGRGDEKSRTGFGGIGP